MKWIQPVSKSSRLRIFELLKYTKVVAGSVNSSSEEFFVISSCFLKVRVESYFGYHFKTVYSTVTFFFFFNKPI